MHTGARRVATLAAVLLALAGCSVTDADIEHWKHTQRGPRKITTVLVEGRYDQALRVHAARALIEMRHPNANGLDLLQAGLQGVAASDREVIVHQLLPELQTMMTGTAGAQGPTEQMIRAKDAAYVLLRGDGHSSFTSAEDRTTLANAVLDWVLADFNTRALAGSYTAEQLVQAIGPSAATRLTAAIQGTDAALPVVVNLSQLIKQVATSQGKQEAAARLVSVATELEGPQSNDRLRASARQRLQASNREATEPAVNAAAEFLRNQYLLLVFEALKTLEQPNGTDYLLRVAANPAFPAERRKTALAAIQGQVSTSHVQTLFAIATCDQTPPPAGTTNSCDLELRGIAVDRLGETRDRSTLPRMFTMYDAANGGVQGNGFMLRWKLGEAILRLGGSSSLGEFMTHLGARTVGAGGFPGYTFAELNGQAQAVGDMNPAPRDGMRAFVTPNHPMPVRVMAMLFLQTKGEERDLALLQQYAADAMPVAGEGWNELTPAITTVGQVAARAREGLQNVLRSNQAAPAAAPGAAPAAP